MPAAEADNDGPAIELPARFKLLSGVEQRVGPPPPPIDEVDVRDDDEVEVQDAAPPSRRKPFLPKPPALGSRFTKILKR